MRKANVALKTCLGRKIMSLTFFFFFLLKSVMNLVCGLLVRDLDYFSFYLRKPITIEKNHYFSLFLNVSEVRINDF